MLSSGLKSFYLIAQLKRNQYYPIEKLDEIQNRKLRNIVEHAYRKVPYYHDLFKSAKIKPTDIKTKDDLKKIPITTKLDIQKNYPDRIIAEDIDINKCNIGYTSGSTGIPLPICQDKKALLHSSAFFNYVFFECGMRLNHVMADIRYFKYPERRHWFEKLGILRTYKVDINQPTSKIVECLKSINPDCLYAHTSPLPIIMDYINENNIDGISPKLIFTHSEIVDKNLRKYIRKTFGIEPNNTYGSAEFWRLGFECNEHKGLHMISDAAIIELVRNDEYASSKKAGEIVVTSLYNYAMPFIRYNLGDIGIATDEKCTCGRTYPLIKDIVGRKNDVITLPSGRKISWVVINMQLTDVPEITQRRVIQLKKDKFLVEIVKSKRFSKRTITEVKNAVKRGCLGEEVEVDVNVIKEIPRDKSGKTKVIISKVSN